MLHSGLLDKLVRAERFREPITGMAADRLDFFPLRIFVVEDDNDSLAAIQIYLEQLGHIVFFCR